MASDLFFYKVFGIQLKSTIELNQLIEIAPISDINIEVVEEYIIRPDNYTSHLKPNLSYKYRLENYFYLELNQIVKYEVRKSGIYTKVSVEILDSESLDIVYAWFYGSILTAVLQMNDIFALHASAILKGNELFLFSGKSGIGKSTLAMNLLNKGYELLTDDKCVLTWNEITKKFIFQPSVQVVRLWKDAIDKLDDIENLGEMTPVVNKVDKFQLKIKNLVKNEREIDLHSINVIRNAKSLDTIKLVTVQGRNKIKLLNLQTHRNVNILPFGKVESHWNYINLIASHCNVNLILRPLQTNADDFANFIESNIVKSKIKS